jgi:hypothetical protein
MKNKKLLYILVPAVVIVWAAVAFSIFSHVHSSDTNFEEINLHVNSKTVKNDSSGYQLIANYRDPFNAGMRTANEEDISEQERLNRLQKMNQPITWPQIEYQGMIIHNKKWVVLLKINNSNLIMKEGDEQFNIKLLKMYNDSVLLKYQKNNKVFVKSRGK